MKISCPSCSAKYSIADEKVQSRLAKIRCRKCGTSIVIDGNTNPPNVYAGESDPQAGGTEDSGPADAAEGTTFTVDFGENDQRPMGTADLVAAYNSGAVTAETYVWADGFADWTPLGQVDEIVTALHQAAASGVAAASVDETSSASQSTAPATDPWNAGAGAAATPAPAVAAPAAAAAPAADLFGGIDAAGSEQEIATSASTGSSGSSDPSPFGSSPSGTGARNESSVLFSLSALTSAAGSTSKPSMPPSQTDTSSTSEDSGLIDLRALTAAAEHRPAAAAPVAVAAAPLGTSPLGLGSPLGTSNLGASGPSIPPQPAKSNTVLYVVAGLVVAVIAVTLIVRLTGKEEPVAPVAPVATAAPIPTAAPTAAALPTAEPLPTAEAKAPSTGTAEEEDAPATVAGGAKKAVVKKSTAPKSTAPSASPSPSPAPKAPPKAAASKCGCAAGDLMCNMRCSSK